MEIKRFTKNDSGFTCLNCNKEVKALEYTSRNHCPYCLHSLHADENPGDRASLCRGIMRPLRVETNPKKGFVIVFYCTKCGAVKRNKAAADDNKELLIKLTAGGG